MKKITETLLEQALMRLQAHEEPLEIDIGLAKLCLSCADEKWSASITVRILAETSNKKSMISAIIKAARKAIQELSPLVELTRADPEIPLEQPCQINWELLDARLRSDTTDLDKLDLSVRSWNAFKNKEINTVGEIFEKLTFAQFLAIKNFGQRSYEEVFRKLTKFLSDAT